MNESEPTKLGEIYSALPFWQRRTLLIISLFLVIVPVSAAVSSGVFLLLNKPENAIPFASVASSVATVVLVGVTFWYAFETRRLVRITENRHQEERKTDEYRQIKKRNALRKALAQEIGKKAYLDDLAEQYSLGHSRIETLIPKTVYKANADEIGNLTEEEVDVVVEFYTRADQVENLMKVQREEDTTANQDFLTEFFNMTEMTLDSLLRKLSGGHLDPSRRKARMENIRQSLKELAANQDRAITVLEENIEPVVD